MLRLIGERNVARGRSLAYWRRTAEHTSRPRGGGGACAHRSACALLLLLARHEAVQQPIHGTVHDAHRVAQHVRGDEDATIRGDVRPHSSKLLRPLWATK